MAAHDLGTSLSSLLDTATDGWIHPEGEETVEQAHEEPYDEILEAVLSNEAADDDKLIRSEGDLRKICPSDRTQPKLATGKWVTTVVTQSELLTICAR